jgi:hypothetical protein
MIAKPDIAVSTAEPIGDRLGQFWSPASVTMSWPPSDEVPSPVIVISLVAPIRGQMTIEELRAAHLQAAHDVLSAAILSVEERPKAHHPRQQKVKR